MGVWPQVKSALPWDAAAISTYFLVSLLFWFVGLIPDLAALRDHAPTIRARKIYALFAMGWRGDARAWRHWKVTYLMLASIATPLVISVHSVVSSDFAIGLTPGWHTTLQPPYFVAGAIFILDNCAKLMLATGLIVDYGYLIEHFGAYYHGDPAERSLMFGYHPTSAAFWTMIACNVVVPQIFWSRRARRSKLALLLGSLAILLGMWLERFVIIVQGLMRDQLPSAWGSYSPTIVDLGILLGTFGFFGFLFLLFLRFVPFLPVAEMKAEIGEEA
jgi:Ni/Fe-hydrogenase subunit HybB-like protein